MKKTNKKVFLYSKYMGWNINRRIYLDADGDEVVIINGSPIQLNWVISRADYFDIY